MMQYMRHPNLTVAAENISNSSICKKINKSEKRAGGEREIHL